MQFTVIALGTRGDVTPLVAIAGRLHARGHTVTVVSHPEFAPIAARAGAAFRAVPGSFQDFLATPQGRRALGAPRTSPLGLAHLMDPFAGCAETVYREAWAASEGTEGLVCSTLAMGLGAELATRRRCHVGIVMATPSVKTRHASHPTLPQLALGPAYHRATWAVGRWLVMRSARPVVEAWAREAARLGPAPNGWQPRVVTVIPVSPHLMPRPADWPDAVHLTGFCYPPPGTPHAPEPAVAAFLAAGEPPLVLGFGSMADDAPDALRAVVRETLARLRMRAVVVGGSGGALSGLARDADVCEVPFVDYDWLFPRAAAVVHQGGAGTLSYGLRAGVPHVTVPYCLDHAFWTHRLQAFGVAPPPIGRHRLTAATLASRVRQALDTPALAARAREVAPGFRTENGADASADALLRVLSS